MRKGTKTFAGALVQLAANTVFAAALSAPPQSPRVVTIVTKCGNQSAGTGRHRSKAKWSGWEPGHEPDPHAPYPLAICHRGRLIAMTEKMNSVICGVSAAVLVLVLNALLSFPASAWGDEGHEVVALIAQAHLDPAVQKRVNALLGADTDSLTAHDIAAEATWADKLCESGGNGVRQMTRQWHYIDIEIIAPDLDRACFDHPSVPPGTPASKSPARDCIVDKIQEFPAEVSSPATDPEDRL